jgi:outer membrane protein assembly factor BamD
LTSPVSSITGRPHRHRSTSARVHALALVAVLVLIGLFSPQQADAARRKLTLEEQYELGLKQLKRGYYVKALEQFNRIRNYHRDDPLAVKAELAIADVYYKKHEWDQARDAYEDFLRWHPRYVDADYVVFRLGMSMYKKSNRIAARDQTWTVRTTEIWSGFGSRFADSEYKEEVDEKLQECRERLGEKELIIAQFYRRRKSWESVERRASTILANHAATESMPEGMGLLAEARAWQGEASEATALVDKLETLDAREAARARRRVSRAQPELPVPGA